MDTVSHRKIIVKEISYDINIPQELILYSDSDNIDIPQGPLNYLYKIENSVFSKNNEIKYDVLFLEDVLEKLEINKDNLEKILKIWPLEKKNVLIRWYQIKKGKGDWNDISNNPSVDFEDKELENYRENIVSLYEIEWFNYKKNFLESRFIKYNDMEFDNIDYIFTFKSVKDFKYEYLLNLLNTSKMYPYVLYKEYCKYNVFSSILESWIETINNKKIKDPNKIYFLYNYKDLNLQMDKDLVVYNKIEGYIIDVDEWIDIQQKDLHNYLTDLEISNNDINKINKLMKKWYYIKRNTFFGSISIRDKKIIIKMEQVLSKDIKKKIIADLNTIFLKTNLITEQVETIKGHQSIKFIYRGININPDILINIIMNTEIVSALVFVKESYKTFHVKNEKGSFRIDFYIGGRIVKCNLRFDKSKNQNILILMVRNVDSETEAYRISLIFGIILDVYKTQYKVYRNKYRKLIRNFDTEFADPCIDKNCKNNSDCKKCGPCLPVTNKCTEKYTNTSWYQSGMTHGGCEKKKIPFIIQKENVELLESKDYIIEEFPTGSSKYITCNKQSEFKYPYIIQKGELFSPCCGKQDDRLVVSSTYDKYYENLKNKELNKSSYIRVEITKYRENNIDKEVLKQLIPLIVEFSKENQISIIGTYKKQNKIYFLELKTSTKKGGTQIVDQLVDVMNNNVIL